MGDVKTFDDEPDEIIEEPEKTPYRKPTTPMTSSRIRTIRIST